MNEEIRIDHTNRQQIIETCEYLIKQSELAAPAGSESELEMLKKQNAAMRSALEGWIKYFQSEAPMTADAMEEQAEAFTHCWFETERVLSSSKTL